MGREADSERPFEEDKIEVEMMYADGRCKLAIVFVMLLLIGAPYATTITVPDEVVNNLTTASLGVSSVQMSAIDYNVIAPDEVCNAKPPKVCIHPKGWFIDSTHYYYVNISNTNDKQITFNDAPTSMTNAISNSQLQNYEMHRILSMIKLNKTFAETNYTFWNITYDDDMINMDDPSMFNGYSGYIYILHAPRFYSDEFNFSIKIDSKTLSIDPPISACGTLGTNNSVYTLTQTINGANTNPACIYVTAENVTLDCDGYSINALGVSYDGLYTNSFNTTVQNCYLKNFGYGNNGYDVVYDTYANNGTIKNTTATYDDGAPSSGYGLYMLSSYNNISDCNLAGGSDAFISSTMHWYGLVLSSSHDNNIKNITANGGIKFSSSDNNTLNICSCDEHAGGGSHNWFALYLLNSNGNIITNCSTISYRDHGESPIYLSSSNNNVIINVSGDDRSEGGAGITLSSSNNNTISNCSATKTDDNGDVGYGIHLSSSSNNTIDNCYIAGKGFALHEEGYAIRLDTSNGNVIKNSELIAQTAAYGYDWSVYIVSSSNNTFKNNTLSDSGHKTLLTIDASSDSNIFYWNNFTNVGSNYVDDTNGNNYYNSSESGNNEGNIWYNVMNGSVLIGGYAYSLGFPSLYVGFNGTNYPYNHSNSLNKVSTGVIDYAPITNQYTLPPIAMMYLNLTPTIPYVTNNLLVNATCIGTGTLTAYVKTYNETTAYGTLHSAVVSNNVNTNFYNLTAGTAIKHENWTAEGWCGNGVLNSTHQNTSAVTIQDSPPSMVSSVITPTYDYITLQGYCNATDADNDTLTYYYDWFMNGTLNKSGISTSTNSRWYSEENISEICDGSWNPSYPCANTYDEDWNTFGAAANPPGTHWGYAYVNYTKPSNASSSSLWEVKDSPTGDANYSIPADCFSQVQLQFKMAVRDPVVGGGNVDEDCWNGTNWIPIFTEITSGSVIIYEQQMWWNVPSGYPQGLMVNVDNISLSMDNWTLECIANDGEENSSALNSTKFGTLPTTPTVLIPTTGNFYYAGQDMFISYTMPAPSVGHAINFSSIALLNYPSNTTYAVISADNGNNTNYTWPIPAGIDSGKYVVSVTACDNMSFCSSSVSAPFMITGGISDISINTINDLTTVTFTISSTNASQLFNCSATVDDTTNSGNQTIYAGLYFHHVFTVAARVHTMNLQCWYGDPVIADNITEVFTTFGNQYPYNFTIDSNFSQNIIIDGQALFYGVNGDLNLLYFTNTTPTNTLYVVDITSNGVPHNITSYRNISLNKTKDYYAIFREASKLEILTYGTDNVTEYFIEVPSAGPLSVRNYSTTYNVLPNEYYDPYTYANTKQYNPLILTPSSYYLFWLPTTANTTLMKKNIDNDTIVPLKNFSMTTTGARPALMTLANDSHLQTWYYCDGSGDNFSLGYYNGSTLSYIKNLSFVTTNETYLNSTNCVLESYGGKLFAYIYGRTANDGNASLYFEDVSTGNSIGYLNMTDASDLIFIDNTTVVFAATNVTGSKVVFSCYFNDTDISCITFSALDYGISLPYDRGLMTSSKRAGDVDIIAKGISVLLSNQSILMYSYNAYDVKYICYDEVDEYRKVFISNLESNASAVVLTKPAWGYVIPSAYTGTGQKKEYATGLNGTNRMYLVGLNGSYRLDIYSLNTWQGSSCPFTIQNQFGAVISGATVSAYRFEPLKQNYVVVEQGITDYQGQVIFFLELGANYKIVVEQNGYVVISFDLIPTTCPQPIIVHLVQSSNTTVKMPEYVYMWDDVSYLTTPDTGLYNETNITYHVMSATAKLEYYGLNVTKTYNGTTTTVYYQNVSGSPSGLMFIYHANETGEYDLNIWFKSQNYSLYKPPTIKVWIGPSTSWMQASKVVGTFISGFGYYVMAVIVAMLVAGFVSNYSISGAGIVGLVVLWIFTLFNPSAQVVMLSHSNPLTDHNQLTDPLTGQGELWITSTEITAFTTLMVLAAWYLVQPSI